MQNMGNQMQNMGSQMNYDMNNMNNQLNVNMNANMGNLNRNLGNMNYQLNSNLNNNMRNFNNMNTVQYQNFNNNNNNVSTSIVHDPSSHVSIVTITRNGVTRVHRVRDSNESSIIINKIINNNFVPNEELVNSLPERVMKQDDLNIVNGQKECIVCLSEFCLEEKVITLPCLHIFHSDCIKNWLDSSEECPICKHNINN